MIGDADTIPPERGLFLGVTYRLRPEICEFVSELSYEGRLRPDPCTALRHVDRPVLIQVLLPDVRFLTSAS